VTQLLVVVLAVMWIVVLVPPLLRSRSIGRPSSSVGDFRRQLSTLQTTPTVRSHGASHLRPVAAYRPSTGGTRTAVRPVAAPMAARSAMKQRRQNILVGLVALAAVTAIIGFGMPIRAIGLLNLLVDVLLAGYLYLLVQIKKTQQAKSVRYDWSRAA
jgi:hypothetical protein